ncbi:hypothetical protein JX265_008962 [Neoarthrinium moseri]|uniref:F-box domain-containing protein n=1 Tax=Neoarthrinium moseri TaxID=1658444 RepID=A0A9P9WGV7_9PEZI|nr:hypothetical protein JX265_008962 [Neoarthrinium moseri]
MNRLPQEIIDQVVSFLPGGPDAGWTPEKQPSRASYACISNKFRHAVECGSFRSLRINSGELQDFVLKFPPRGRPFLRELFFSVELYQVDAALAKRFERPAETAAASKQFSLQIKELFSAIHKPDGIVGLRLYISNVTQTTASAEDESGNGYGIDLGHYRDLRSRLTLLDPAALPHLDCVSHLTFSNWQRKPSPAVYLEIAARLAGLEKLDLVLDSFEMRYPGRLRDDRKSLALALETRSEETQTTSHAMLDMSLDRGAIIQTLPMPNLRYPLEYDVLSSSLRTWSQRLISFSVRGVVDESLFWPHAQDNVAAAPPEWRRMEFFDVQLERHTPSGWWYFMPKGESRYGAPPRNPAEDLEDQPPEFADEPQDGVDPFDQEAEDHWDMHRRTDGDEDHRIRNVPNEDTMQPLLEAWAKALARMPLLRRAKISFEVEIPNSETQDEEDVNMEDWEIIYEAPDLRGAKWEKHLEASERASRCLIFHNTCGWRPAQRTMHLLQQVGLGSHPGTEMAILTVNEWNRILR